MKRNILNIAIGILSLIVLSFSSNVISEPPQASSVIIQFVTTNGFGNNLYIDNISFGNRPVNDIAIISINNIKKDTTFLPGVPLYSFSPIVSVVNLGQIPTATPAGIILSIGRYGYLDKVYVSLQAGESQNVYFPPITVFPNRPLDILVYLDSAYTLGDSNQVNDTIRQNSIFLNGALRNVLFEEFTSSTSPACASNNPALNNYIDSNFNTICAIKYHLGFPIPGNDSMYLPDTLQKIQRSNYYFVNAVPDLVADGIYRMPLPYSYVPNIDTAYNKRMYIGAPVSLTVNDTRPGGDTIQTDIVINNLYNLPNGDYRLRIVAVERLKNYENPPGLNGETQFYDIFRQMYPDSAGIVISPVQGTYNYSYRYIRNPDWVDSMVYTVAFIQNDNTKEVLNSAKGRQIPVHKFFSKTDSRLPVIYKPDINKSARFSSYGHYNKPKSDTGIVNANFELFEEPFPPPGWTMNNPDKGLTFMQVQGVNGISFGGLACAMMPFYYYSNIGQRDTLTSKAFYNVTASDSLRFDYSYAQYLTEFADTLTVNLSTDGGNTFITIFRFGGAELATSAATTSPYAPVSAADWKTYVYPMSAILPTTINPLDVKSFDLFPNYPNPFNPKTTIKFQVPNSSYVTIKIYDIAGRELIKLINQKMNKGIYTVEFNGNNFASGIYFCQMVSGNFVKVQKLALVK